MGLLDDAIREHLELKRRRGADPAEVERAEHEALGPVRRGPVETEPPELMIDEGHAYEESEGAHWDNGYDDELEPPAEGGATYVDSEPPAPAAQREVPLEDLGPDDELGLDDRPSGEAPAQQARSDYEEPAPHRAPALPGDQLGETVEYDVEEAFDEPEPSASPPAKAADGEPRDTSEDPLEETPEFLQDTPDHDRLWFEQRPPRDFDFDG